MTHLVFIIVPRVSRGVEVRLREAEGRQHRVAPSSASSAADVEVAVVVQVEIVPSSSSAAAARMARVDGEGSGGREDGHHGRCGADVAEGGAQVEAAAQQVAAPAAPVGVGVHKLSGRRLVQGKARNVNIRGAAHLQ